jgi:hypothetical protein
MMNSSGWLLHSFDFIGRIRLDLKHYVNFIQQASDESVIARTSFGSAKSESSQTNPPSSSKRNNLYIPRIIIAIFSQQFVD